MTLTGRCHCGQTMFRIHADVPAQLTRCTCSLCAKRGMLWAYYTPDQFELLAPHAGDAVYRWNTGLIDHHFCATCGCSTFSNTPAYQSDSGWDGVTRRIGVNARLFDDFDAAQAPVAVVDGKHLW
jgi:hypothetical protein